MRQLLFISALMISTAALADDAPTSPQPNANVKAANEKLLSQTPEAAGVFVVQDDGSIRHQQSGMVCPASFPNLDFYKLMIFPSAETGNDVGCDYRRADEKGGAWAKMTIFATKAREGLTLDQAFAGYENEVMKYSPNAQSQGSALKAEGDTSKLPEFRSEEFLEPLNGATYTTQLYVTMVRGWVVEVRTTFVGLPNVISAPDERGQTEAKLWIEDRAMGPTTPVSIPETVGK